MTFKAVGDAVTFNICFSKKQCRKFAQGNGDQNPIHAKKKAAKLVLKADNAIVSGMQIAQSVGAYLGSTNPGPGTLVTDIQVSFSGILLAKQVMQICLTVTDISRRQVTLAVVGTVDGTDIAAGSITLRQPSEFIQRRLLELEEEQASDAKATAEAAA